MSVQHGVRRVRQSREAQEAKQERDKAKLAAYLALTDDVLARVRSLALNDCPCADCFHRRRARTGVKMLST